MKSLFLIRRVFIYQKGIGCKKAGQNDGLKRWDRLNKIRSSLREIRSSTEWGVAKTGVGGGGGYISISAFLVKMSRDIACTGNELSALSLIAGKH